MKEGMGRGFSRIKGALGILVFVWLLFCAASAEITVTVDEVPLTGVKDNSGKYLNVFTIDKENANVVVSGKTSNSQLLITANNVTVTLNNVEMELQDCNGSPIEIAGEKSATLILIGTNTLKAFAAAPGILVNNGATLTIADFDEDEEIGKLNVEGAKNDRYVPSNSGLTVMYQTGYAGIGGPNSSTSMIYTGTIRITGGQISATGYGYGAGIGGGDFSSGGTIEISGGNVTAKNDGNIPQGYNDASVAQASGIGASQGQASGKITISGNAVVTAYGGYACAGIGGSIVDVTIQDFAVVTTYGGDLAAGIGGYNSNKGNSQISILGNSCVTAYGGTGAAGIGQGSNNTAKFDLTIASTATVRGYSDGKKAGIVGTATSGSSAALLNLFLNAAAFSGLPQMEIPLVLTDAQGGTTTEKVPQGYWGLGMNIAAGGYDVQVNLANGIQYSLTPSTADERFQADTSGSYAGQKANVLFAVDFNIQPQDAKQNAKIDVQATGTSSKVVQNEEKYGLTAGTYCVTIEATNYQKITETITVSQAQTFTYTMTLSDADYGCVDEALEKVPADLSIYTEETAEAVKAAVKAVERGKPITQQAEVDAMAAAIEAALAALVQVGADYSRVDRAIEAAAALNAAGYKDFSAVEAAIQAVERGKPITQQAAVDAMAKAIEDAMAALEVVLPPDNMPKTGDASNLMLWVLLLIASGAVLISVGRRKRVK